MNGIAVDVELGMLSRKRFETARARAALRGIALHALEDDGGAALYVASIHALTRQFASLPDVERWLDGIAVDAERGRAAAP